VYHYDSTVPNHKRISEGDIAVIRDSDKLLGVARIERLSSYNGQKIRLRCPICNSVHLKKRKRINPPYRCENKHVFAVPSEERLECVHYKAFFGNSFVATLGVISLTELRNACPSYSEQFAMQKIDMQGIAARLLDVVPAVEHLVSISLKKIHYLSAEDADEQPRTNPGHGGNAYVPTGDDRRDTITRAIRVRRGQQAFRESLIARYGSVCMITGCHLLDVVEAAHISPYRGANDQHEENGLLLRSDIHILFDLELMGIEPRTLRVTFHPTALAAGYQEWEGKKLRCQLRPSREALGARWLLFLKRLES
jgi:putative restriction endonuclease